MARYNPLDEHAQVLPSCSKEESDSEVAALITGDALDGYEMTYLPRTRGIRSALLPRMNIAGGVLAATLAAISVWVTIQIEKGGSNAPRFRPQWSPMYDEIDIPVIEKTLDPFIPWKPDHPDSIYTQDPSPETDAAWERLTHSMTFIPLTAEHAIKMGKDPAFLIQIPDGMGHDGRYLATQDTLHQIHCLDYLRKSLIHNYHYYWGEKWGFWPPFSLVRHLTHCVDILRQHLMCNADFELYTFNWRVSQKIKWPDFGVRKTCRDFDALLKHLEATQSPHLVKFYRNITKPSDANELPVPLGVWEYITQETYVNSAGTSLNPIPGLRDKPYCLG
ncbi:hypothetical protein AC579_211 [Pseudocercospora musae]|uniref:Tat pathway signal sequence n=1 Tax=Pseudocercospora musae TaxID=113226 RepID=A0A139I7N0_9PEZI|nr:hypothetical protein AC579_211 [Pseudocercospora musae]KXT10705.1 hypothetical protein AC579_211 [Pseudocercospora musae]